MFSLLCSIAWYVSFRSPEILLFTQNYSAWFAYFLPCFATYKTLSKRPVVDADVERLCMYWTVVGLFVGFEYIAQWFISWYVFEASFAELELTSWASR